MSEYKEGHEESRNHPHVAGLTHCVVCGASGYPDDRFCPCCGNAMAHVCSSCGEIVRQPIAFYCTRCGAALYGDGEERRK